MHTSKGKGQAYTPLHDWPYKESPFFPSLKKQNPSGISEDHLALLASYKEYKITTCNKQMSVLMLNAKHHIFFLPLFKNTMACF